MIIWIVRSFQKKNIQKIFLNLTFRETVKRYVQKAIKKGPIQKLYGARHIYKERIFLNMKSKKVITS